MVALSIVLPLFLSGSVVAASSTLSLSFVASYRSLSIRQSPPATVSSQRRVVNDTFRLRATLEAPSSSSSETAGLAEQVLETVASVAEASNEYADMFGLSKADAAVYALFLAIRKTSVPLGLRGAPFVLRNNEIEAALQQPTEWPGYFTMENLEKAVNDDFLDAARGSTDNRKGWKVSFDPEEITRVRCRHRSAQRFLFRNVDY